MTKKHHCYNCDKELEENEVYFYPVLEDADPESAVEAPFCEECYQKVAEPDY